MPIISLCGNVGTNTGPIACDIKRGVPKVIMLGGASFDDNDYSSNTAFQAALLSAINLATGDPGKLFPFPEIQNVTNNTEANTTGTTGLGFQLILREGKPAYTFGVIVGSNLEKRLRAFNNQIVPVFVFDNNGNVWGKLDADGNFVGTQALIFVAGKPYSDGNSVDTEYTNVSVSFLSATEFHDDAAFVNTTFNISNLEGLLDATLYELGPNNDNVHKIGVKVINTQLGADVNLYDKYSTELATASLWEAHHGTTFSTPITITSVAGDAGNKVFTFTYDSTMYNGLADGVIIRTRLKPPPVLLAAGVRGIEGIPIMIKKLTTP